MMKHVVVFETCNNLYHYFDDDETMLYHYDDDETLLYHIISMLCLYVCTVLKPV